MLALRALMLTLSLGISMLFGLNDGFHFGGGCKGGSGAFEQQIKHYHGDYENAVTVGTIPAGIEGLVITLKGKRDVDIRLYADDGTRLVHWPFGLLNGPARSEVNYKGAKFIYSGYNGDGTGKGHEYIKLIGKATEQLTMKVFGYQSGFAKVHYTWDVAGSDNNTTTGGGDTNQTNPGNTTPKKGSSGNYMLSA